MSDIKSGTYEAKIVDYSIGTTKKGDPMAMVRFNFCDTDGASHNITWYGTFGTEKSAEISCENLAICGWRTKNPADLAKGVESGVLDVQKIVSIVVAADTYNGTTRMKVKYINEPGGAGFRDAMEHKDAVKVFNGLNLGGIAAAAQKKHTKTVVNHAPNFDTDEPIPF